MGATSDDTLRLLVVTVSVIKLEQVHVSKVKSTLRGHLKHILTVLLVYFCLMADIFHVFIRCASFCRIHARCRVSFGFSYLMCDMFACSGYKKKAGLGACKHLQLRCECSTHVVAVQTRIEDVIRAAIVEFQLYTGEKVTNSDRENCGEFSYCRGWMGLEFNHKWEI